MLNIERNIDARIKCYKCGNEYEMGMMRMDPNGKNLACRSCLERKSAKQDAKAVPEAQKQETIMKEYFCKECKYNFSRAKHLALSACPYCGTSGSLMIKGSTAKIMADSFKMKG